jgi:hypothetical protein
LVQQKIKISRDVNFDERIGFKKYIEEPIESNEEEEHEDTKEEIICSLEKYNEEQETPHESMEPTTIPKTIKILAWLETTL